MKGEGNLSLRLMKGSKGLTDDCIFYNLKLTVSSEVMVRMMPGGRGVIGLIFADLGHWPPRTDTPL